MDIVGTINPWGCNDFIGTIRNVIDLGIKTFRVNLKTYYEEDHFEYLLKIIREMLLINNELSFIFDIGFPRDTSRTIINNENGYIKVEGNNLYLSNESSFFSNDTVFINEEVELKVGDIIFYGDGQYYFIITEHHSDGRWKAKTNISDITIWGNTAVHFHNEVHEKPYNMNLICMFFEEIKSQIDYKVALSFVESQNDIENFFRLCGNQEIICKIESQKAIDNLDEIVENCNYIMLGRGDLFFNARIEDFLKNQITVIKKCIEKNKTVIVSTGILTSMKDDILPDRADLIDFLMLNELGVQCINLSSHLIQSTNIKPIVELINGLYDTKRLDVIKA